MKTSNASPKSARRPPCSATDSISGPVIVAGWPNSFAISPGGMIENIPAMVETVPREPAVDVDRAAPSCAIRVTTGLNRGP